MPVEPLIVVPLLDLPEFAAHEEEFFSGMSIHPREEHSEIGKFLPFVARHLHEERAFAVHDFIVTEHQNKMFLKSVKQRERDVAVMKPAVNRIEAHVLQKVVHPTHVPFEAEPESAEISRPGYSRPRG